MHVGAFSLSLTVKDLEQSKKFYQNLGFTPFAGEEDNNGVLLRNGEHVLGLFQDMFPKNIITFNPGWDQHGQNTEQFTDVRELQQQLSQAGIKTVSENLEGKQGPGSFTLEDPDGNVILFDQHR